MPTELFLSEGLVMARFHMLLFVLLAGCGSATPSSTVDLQGAVVLDGKPISRGTISFIPEPGTKGAAVGGEIVDGRYSVLKVARGRHRVFVQPATESGEPATSTDAAKPAVSVAPLPVKFRNGLLTTVTDNGELDIGN